MVNKTDFSRICVIDYFEWGARYNILDIFHSEEKRDFRVWSINYTQLLLFLFLVKEVDHRLCL